MAFPNVTLKDAFTGDGPLSANWMMGPDPIYGMDTLVRISDAAAPTEDPSGNWWVAEMTTADVDIVADIKNDFEDFGTYIKLYFRIQEAGGVITDGYAATFGSSVFDGVTTKIFLIRTGTAFITDQFDTGKPPLTNGSRIGIRVVDDTVACYIDYGDGNWILETTFDTGGALTGPGRTAIAWTQITPHNPA